MLDNDNSQEKNLEASVIQETTRDERKLYKAVMKENYQDPSLVDYLWNIAKPRSEDDEMERRERDNDVDRHDNSPVGMSPRI